jgi:hypothetical protein
VKTLVSFLFFIRQIVNPARIHTGRVYGPIFIHTIRMWAMEPDTFNCHCWFWRHYRWQSRKPAASDIIAGQC